ncbi:hypothetical protein VDGE_30496 [Verticillium dahliae]|uniref:Uncharacterized protein n=1 Tax=Verticillium dahliae TaxID=27337 RepID=A0A444RRW7_VERDA|nr:hypothetical protein VDGE_30496 [Verticillium dahliae]
MTQPWQPKRHISITANTATTRQSSRVNVDDARPRRRPRHHLPSLARDGVIMRLLTLALAEPPTSVV